MDKDKIIGAPGAKETVATPEEQVTSAVCRNCECFFSTNPANKLGECRYNPPRAIPLAGVDKMTRMPVQNIVGAQPPTRETGWCYRFTPITGKFKVKQ